MATIKEFLESVERLDIESLVHNAVRNTKDAIIEYNKKQLEKGISSTGSKMPRYKSAAYAKKKNALNPLAGLGVVDLKFMGNWQEGLGIEFKGSEVLLLGSQDGKAPFIEKRFIDALGLSPDSKEDYVLEVLLPAIAAEITKQTGLKVNIK